MSIQRWKFRRIWPLLSAAWIALWAWPTLDALQEVLDAHRSVLAARREARLEAANRSRDPPARAEDHALRNYLSAQGPATFSLAVAERGLALRKTRLAERATWLVGGPVATGAAALALYVLFVGPVARSAKPATAVDFVSAALEGAASAFPIGRRQCAATAESLA